jgi:hypothetical protein
VLTFLLDTDDHEDYLDGDNDTLSILGQIFNKAMSPPPDAPSGDSGQPGPSGQNAVDTPGSSESGTKSGHVDTGDAKVNNGDTGTHMDNGDASAKPDQDLPVASDDASPDASPAPDASPEPDPDLPVASNNDASHDPDLDLPVASPPKGRGHRYVTRSPTQLTLTLFV